MFECRLDGNHPSSRSVVLFTSNFYGNQRAQAGRIDVFRYSGNFGAGDHYSRDFIFTSNFESQPGDAIGQKQTGIFVKWPNAIGSGGLHTMAGFDRSLHAALETGCHYLSVCRSQPGVAALDIVLGHNRLQEKLNAKNLFSKAQPG